MRLSRSAALAYRCQVHQIDGSARSLASVAVLAAGVQDTPPGTTAGRALGVRLGSAPPAEWPASLALVHSMRGTMHLHRAADLGLLAAALRPDEASDLLRSTFGTFFADAAGAGVPVGEAYDEVAGKMAAVMSDGVARSKGELSTALNDVVDERLRPWCSGCGVAHVHDGLFRLASLPAGLRLLPLGDGSADFVAGPGPAPVSSSAGGGGGGGSSGAAGGSGGAEGAAGGSGGATGGGAKGAGGAEGAAGASGSAGGAKDADPGAGGAKDAAGGSGGASARGAKGADRGGDGSAKGAHGANGADRGARAGDGGDGARDDARKEVVRRYLRFCGPTSRDGLAAWLGVSPAAARRWWALVADELEPVEVDGRKLSMHRDDVADAQAAAAPPSTPILVPPYDPMLELCDRELLVTDPAQRKQLWRAVANPGAVLVGGEVVGVWRRRQGVVTVTGFGDLSAKRRGEIARETDGEVVFA